MRQVPHTHYLIIGDGRLASHMSFYLHSLSCSFSQWSRSKNPISLLHTYASHATHIWILIRDDAILSFIQEHLLLYQKQAIFIHSAGALSLKEAYGAHPLQTFQSAHYAASSYPLIPFFIDADSPFFTDLLPGLPNPHYRITPADKAFYHALCVMANNFTTLLWQKFFIQMQEKFNCPTSSLEPILQQTFYNLQHHPFTALTGPIARQDYRTLERDLKALEGDPYYAIFKAFIEIPFHAKRE